MPQRGSTGLIRATAVARVGWAGVLLLVPERVLRMGGGPPVPAGAVVVARVLGARELLQAALTAVAPTGSVAGLGAVVDALHASTSVGLAAVSPRWRPIALTDAAIAGGLAVAGWTGRSRATGWTSPGRVAGWTGRSRVAGWGGRVAGRLGR
jgi:hypothetical protein